MSTATESMETWAAREAPKLDHDGWRWAEQDARGEAPASYRTYAWSLPQARALLAYRDRVAEGLVDYERSVLAGLLSTEPKRWGAAVGVACETLRSAGLIAHDYSCVTPLGREIARILTQGDTDR